MASEKVFLSYAHSDNLYCKKLCSLLTHCGIPFWCDENGLPPSAEDFNELIEDAIDDCKYFICVWTAHIKDSDYCKKELERAFEWKKREPQRNIYILKMEENLDNLTDLPRGCNILASGANFIEAHNDDVMEQAVKRIATQLFDGSIQGGLSLEIFQKEIREYATKELANIKLPIHISVTIDKNGNDHDYRDIVTLLSNHNKVFLHGERGSGRTAIICATYKALLEKLVQNVDDDASTYYVPIYIELEKIWNWHAVVIKDVLHQLCGYMSVPYCTDKAVEYVILLDGEMRTTRGYLPEIVDSIIDENSGIYSVLVSQTVHQFLDSSFKDFEVRKLNFSEVVNYVVKKIGNEVQIRRFFKRLLFKAFEDTSYDESVPNIYFKTIKKIYRYFVEESENENSSITIDDFYSINLAETTQKGRLPQSLVDDDEIIVWKKLIKGNEIFHAIRTPFYLNQLIELYSSDKDLVFPYRLRTLQIKICQRLIDDLDSNAELKQKMIWDFLVPLALSLNRTNGGNKPITISAFRKIVNNTNFDRIKRILNEGGIINIANNDVVFQYDFLYDYFLNCAETSDADRIEAKLRTCRSTELTRLFLAYISHNEPFAEYGKDAVEIATDIIMDERDSFKMTDYETRQAVEIIKKKLKLSNNAHQRASILNGIGKMFNRLDLSKNEDDFFDVQNESFWCKIGEDMFLSALPITFYYFNIFIADGYQNEEFWEYGRESIVMKDGGIRIRPLKTDDGITRVFEIPNHPVVGITWYEANAFCKWLQKKLGNSVEVFLPRVEHIRKYLNDVAIESKLYNSQNAERFDATTPVGIFSNDNNSPIDIVGNVWEWSGDEYDFYGDKIVSCYGGSWTSTVNRDRLLTTYPAKLSSNNIGFRVMVKLTK